MKRFPLQVSAQVMRVTRSTGNRLTQLITGLFRSPLLKRGFLGKASRHFSSTQPKHHREGLLYIFLFCPGTCILNCFLSSFASSQSPAKQLLKKYLAKKPKKLELEPFLCYLSGDQRSLPCHFIYSFSFQNMFRHQLECFMIFLNFRLFFCSVIFKSCLDINKSYF
jgi:hypothetical protein